MSLYTIQNTVRDNEYRIIKFDKDINIQSIYKIRAGRVLSCNCFQGNRNNCRHRDIFREFYREKRIGRGYFWNYEGRQWQQPIGETEL